MAVIQLRPDSRARGDLEKHGRFNWKQKARKYEGEVAIDRIPLTDWCTFHYLRKKTCLQAVTEDRVCSYGLDSSGP